MKLLNKLDIELVIKSLHNAPKEFKVDFASFEEKRGTLTEVYIFAGGDKAITTSFTNYSDDGVEKFEIQLFWDEKKLDIQIIKNILDAVKQVIKDTPDY